MVTTRSAGKQTHLEDFTQQKSATRAPRKSIQSRGQPTQHGGMLSPPPSPTRKRKRKASDSKSEKTKQLKIDGKDATSKEESDDVIIINRAPVLHLWGACVTQFLYPKHDWPTCLSAGNAISTICAIAKGRSIGTIDKPEDTGERKQKKEEDDDSILEVMQFKLKLKDGKVFIGGKPQSSNEEALKKKYGERYEDVKAVFHQGLQNWKGREMDLSKAAFGMYEDFRPNIARGQKGWGRKGALHLKTVGNRIAKK